MFWNGGTGVACVLRMWVELAAAAVAWPHCKPVGPSSVAANAAAKTNTETAGRRTMNKHLDAWLLYSAARPLKI